MEVYEIDEKIKNDDDGRAYDKRPWQNAPGIFNFAANERGSFPSQILKAGGYHGGGKHGGEHRSFVYLDLYWATNSA